MNGDQKRGGGAVTPYTAPPSWTAIPQKSGDQWVQTDAGQVLRPCRGPSSTSTPKGCPHSIRGLRQDNDDEDVRARPRKER